MRFYLGTHHPGWLGRLGVPLFVSRRRLAALKKLPRAAGPWALDSGGYSELFLFGRWAVTAAQYVREVRRWRSEVGTPQWCAQMDWMCEPVIRQKTGLTVREHQRRTTENYLELTALAPEVPWLPVLQGWDYGDYLEHAGAWAGAGVNLAGLPAVGLGSVCRRQGTRLARELVRDLHASGIKVHAFGFKTDGIAGCHPWLESSDSMAWSFAARRRRLRLPGCTHGNCANCPRWALRWRESLLQVLARAPAAQADLFAPTTGPAPPASAGAPGTWASSGPCSG